MSLLDNGVVIESTSKGARKTRSRTLSLSLSPTIMPNFSGISNAPLTADLRYQNNGIQLIIDSAAKAVETLKSLPVGQKETFASGYQQLTSKLQSKASKIVASR
jgi:hypothetical protein